MTELIPRIQIDSQTIYLFTRDAVKRHLVQIGRLTFDYDAKYNIIVIPGYLSTLYAISVKMSAYSWFICQWYRPGYLSTYWSRQSARLIADLRAVKDIAVTEKVEQLIGNRDNIERVIFSALLGELDAIEQNMRGISLI